MAADRVEAAARVLHDRYAFGTTLTWEDASPLTKDRFRADARAMLTAADTADRDEGWARIRNDEETVQRVDHLFAVALEWASDEQPEPDEFARSVLSALTFEVNRADEGFCVCDEQPMRDCGIRAHRLAAGAGTPGGDTDG